MEVDKRFHSTSGLTLPERKDIDFEGGKRIFLNYIAEDERGMINPPEGELLNLYGSTF